MLGACAERLAFLLAVDPAETDAFSFVVVQDFECVAVEEGDDGAGEVGGGFPPRSLRGVTDAPLAIGARTAPKDAAVDQPDREPVLVGPAQRAEYQVITRERDAPTVVGDGVVLL